MGTGNGHETMGTRQWAQAHGHRHNETMGTGTRPWAWPRDHGHGHRQWAWHETMAMGTRPWAGSTRPWHGHKTMDILQQTLDTQIFDWSSFVQGDVTLKRTSKSPKKSVSIKRRKGGRNAYRFMTQNRGVQRRAPRRAPVDERVCTSTARANSPHLRWHGYYKPPLKRRRKNRQRQRSSGSRHFQKIGTLDRLHILAV